LKQDLPRLTQDHARPAEDFHRLRLKYGLRLEAVADVVAAWYRGQLPDHDSLAAWAKVLTQVSPPVDAEPDPTVNQWPLM
jgi:hypothetical protein